MADKADTAGRWKHTRLWEGTVLWLLFGDRKNRPRVFTGRGMGRFELDSKVLGVIFG